MNELIVKAGDLYLQNKIIPALELLTKAIIADGSNPHLYCLLAIIEYQLKNYKTALTHLKKACTLAPSQKIYYNFMEKIYNFLNEK